MRGTANEAAHVSASLSNLDGAIGLDQFERLHHHAADRRRNAEALLRRLSTLPAKSVTSFSPSAMPVKLVYLLPDGGLSPQEAIEILSHYGIEAQGGYRPLHASCAEDSRFPNTMAAWRRVVCVPLETRARRLIPIPFQQPRQKPAAIPVSAAGITAIV